MSNGLIEVHLTIGSYVSERSSRYKVRGKFGEHQRCVRVARGVTSWVLSKLLKCFISRWTHSWRMNQLFYNIFKPMEYLFLEGFVCWLHERAQWEYEARLRNWIWLDKFTSYVIMNIRPGNCIRKIVDWKCNFLTNTSKKRLLLYSALRLTFRK